MAELGKTWLNLLIWYPYLGEFPLIMNVFCLFSYRRFSAHFNIETDTKSVHSDFLQTAWAKLLVVARLILISEMNISTTCFFPCMQTVR